MFRTIILNNMRKTRNFFVDTRKFILDRHEYKKQCGNNLLFSYNKKNEYKILHDYRDSAGMVDPHYFIQDIYVAQYVINRGIKQIYDIGSRIDGYISHLVSSGIKITMIDIRPLPINIENLNFLQGNALNLSSIPDNSLSVLSSLHAIEHFGLGRYGDPIDYDGWKKALNEFAKKVTLDGTLILSVPCGNKDLLMFNAHRIFTPITIYKEISNVMRLESFTRVHNYTTEQFKFSDKSNCDSELEKITESLSEYDCGIFIFKKIKLS